MFICENGSKKLAEFEETLDYIVRLMDSEPHQYEAELKAQESSEDFLE